jgi:hypothetical protein
MSCVGRQLGAGRTGSHLWLRTATNGREKDSQQEDRFGEEWLEGHQGEEDRVGEESRSPGRQEEVAEAA